MGKDGMQEAGNLRIKLDDSQPRIQNHSHPREAEDSWRCSGLLGFESEMPLPEAPDLNAGSLACGVILKVVEFYKWSLAGETSLHLKTISAFGFCWLSLLSDCPNVKKPLLPAPSTRERGIPATISFLPKWPETFRKCEPK